MIEARVIRAWAAFFTAERRAATLAAIIMVQGLCALFFIADVIIDLGEGDHLDHLHMTLEAAASLALIGGMVFLMLELRRMLARMQEMDAGLRAARGRMGEVIEGFFDDWGLTPSERDVALMILKGFENKEIAEIRGAAPGTVRAQSAKVYAKAGVGGRAQLLSLFMDELLSGEAPAHGAG
ncbi:helix-turn-helix transcriptional regulator [Rhodovulum sp. DZ06]|uniref:helix-turn-helix transcriptional regulator n=1 Tax=Rhodovulum sp. DZ06 TaxID=3425126 RepID=UPI003D34F11F